MNKKLFPLSLRRKEMLSGYLFILVWLFGFVAFFLTNFFRAIRYSVSELVIQSAEGGYILNFIGIANYRNIFTEHPTFNQTLVESVINMIIDVPLIIIFSLMIAVMLNRKIKFRGVYRVIFFLPVIMAAEAVDSALEQALMVMMGGISNIPEQVREGVEGTGVNLMYLIATFEQYGIPVLLLEYLTDAVARIYSILRASGVQILIFLAALQSVPSSLYEVVKIEGATAYETFWKVTFPMISPLILTNVIYTIVAMYMDSEIVSLSYDTAFALFNFGVGAAMSIVSSIVTCVILMIAGYAISKGVYYRE